MSSQAKFDEIARLAALLCDGQITEAEMVSLDQLLLDDPAAQTYYRQYIALDVALEWKFFDRTFRPAPVEEGSPEDSVSAEIASLQAEVDSIAGDSALPAPADIPVSQPPGKSPVLGFLSRLGWHGWGYVSGHALLCTTAATILVLGSLTWAVVQRYRHGGDAAGVEQEQDGSAQDQLAGQRPAPAATNPSAQTAVAETAKGAPAVVARLTGASNARWNRPSRLSELGAPLVAGQELQLDAGVAALDFPIGASVVLQGPARLKLLSAKELALESGKLTARITAPQARGFKIVTPDAELVDQGTEFGVEVSPGGSSKVHVFQGMVDVDLMAREGRPAGLSQRLAANAGARIGTREAGVVLVEETGEYFIRSMDEAQRDQHVMAYWRFEDRPVGILLPSKGNRSSPMCATVDSSFNSNDLYTSNDWTRPTLSADVLAASVPRTGDRNRSCLDTSRLTVDSRRIRTVYTHSEFSHAAPLDIQRIAPAKWTIEASVRAAELTGKAQGFLGRDANFTRDITRAPARLTFQINARSRFAIGFYDADGRFHEAVAEVPPVEAGHWYHLAATSDGRVLRLYVDALDGRGYVHRAAKELPATGSTALGKGSDEAEWTIGRAGNVGDPADWPRFQGWIDEVRVSDVARGPAEFLFAPKDKG